MWQQARRLVCWLPLTVSRQAPQRASPPPALLACALQRYPLVVSSSRQAGHAALL
jgi:hypothetical protein